MRHYYAAGHVYGVEFGNDYGTLFRFETREERDAFVSDRNFDEAADGGYKTEAVTRDEARTHFKNAFRTVGDFHDYADERDWIEEYGAGYHYWSEDNLYADIL